MTDSTRQPRATTLVLASGSPRRRELLALAGITPRVAVPDIDESVRGGESPTDYVVRLAREKAAAVDVAVGEVVLAADTTVELDGTALAKPDDAADACRMLAALSGRTHRVHTGVAVGWPTGAGETTDRRDATVLDGAGSPVSGLLVTGLLVTTEVTFVELTPERIERYVASGEPLDKAGAYAIQGAAAAFVRRVEGSVTNVVGLPLAETLELLTAAGCTLPR